jgi:hypothetical protein
VLNVVALQRAASAHTRFRFNCDAGAYMKSSEDDHLAVRLLFFGIDAKGPSAIRMIGRATHVLILAVAASILIISAHYAPSLAFWRRLFF